jgi:hypothetical protein
MTRHIAQAAVTLAAIAAVSVAVAAQNEQEKKTYVEARGNVVPVPLPPGGPAPKMADGHVDFSGVWFSGPTGKANAWSVVREEPERQEPMPYQPWLQQKLDGMSRAERQLLSAQVTCRPLGVPGMWTNNPYPHQIVMKPGIFVHLIESNNNWRVVYTERKAHAKADELEPLYNGDSTVRWEGDTMVVDTISLDPRNWFTDSLHVVERFRRPNKNYLEYQYTLEDPKALTKTWTSAWRTYSLGSEPLIENFCTNNENVEELIKLRDVESAK